MANETMKRMLGMQQPRNKTQPAQAEAHGDDIPEQDIPISVSLDRFQDHRNFGIREAATTGWFQGNELFRGFNIEAQHSVLDLGCGDGGFAAFCSRYAEALTIVDIDDDTVALAQQKITTDSRCIAKVTALTSDSNPLPFNDQQFDRLVCSEVLEHVADPATVLRELHRVGRDDALYLITIPAEKIERLLEDNIAPRSYFTAPNHIRIYSDESFSNYLHEAGFNIVEKHTTGFYNSIWWLMFWLTDSHLDDVEQPEMMRHWSNTWQALLNHPRGAELADKLNDVLPKSMVYLLRKS